MKLDLATRRIDAFRRRFGDGHFYLACHAALPIALTPDLLYCLWANFQRDATGEVLEIPWIAVSDVLLHLCDEVGHELYEMEPGDRSQFLKHLQTDPRLGMERVHQLSDFLIAYVSRDLSSADLDTRDLAEVQRWRALAYKEPAAAAREIALRLKDLPFTDKTEWIRMAGLLDSLTEPLADFQSLLLYSRAIANYVRGKLPEATDQIQEAVDQNHEIRVTDVILAIPDTLKATLSPPSDTSFEVEKPFSTVLKWVAWFVGIAMVIAAGAFVPNLMQKSPLGPLDILKGSDLNKIAARMPAIKQAIDQERQKVDTLPENSDTKNAIAKFNAKKAQINKSLFLHQLFLQKVSDLKERGKLDNESKNYAQDIEKSLALMIHKYRIPFLAVELQQRNFGQLNENSEKTDPPDVQFTPGALRTTYEILMTASGAHADLDGNGTIKSPNQNNPREANQLPCQTLIEIEHLWKEATNGKCGWYGRDVNNPHYDPECEKQLRKYNIHPRASTLATLISENYPDELVSRMKYCK